MLLYKINGEEVSRLTSVFLIWPKFVLLMSYQKLCPMTGETIQ